MPIYAYKCESCGARQDVLQKISDPVLSLCPACGAPSFVKQVTAAGFQLKGSGWYATDFRDGKKPAAADKGDAKTDAKDDAKVDAKSEGNGEARSDTAAAASPAPAAAPAAKPTPPGSDTA